MTKPPAPIPLLRAPFRPLFLLGAAYGPLVILVWASAHAGGVVLGPDGLPLWLWHGHEMVFGFAAALVAGFVLTALPGWAGTPEITGLRLGVLALSWLLGRAGYWVPDLVPAPLAMVLDLAFLPLLLLLVVPGLRRVADRRYWLLVPILLWLIAGNALWWMDRAAGVPLARGLEAGLYGYMILFSIVGGVLTPIFTAAALDDEAAASFSRPLEYAGVAAVVAYGASGILVPDTAWAGAAAVAAAGLNLARMGRWRSRAAMKIPIVAMMHVAFAWLVVGFALRALSDFGLVASGGGGSLAFHAFAVGALPLMKLSLMVRVALKHTGRALAPGRVMTAAWGLALFAPVLRLGAGIGIGDARALMLAAAVCFAVPFAVYLGVCGRFLLTPSLPKLNAGSGNQGAR